MRSLGFCAVFLWPEAGAAQLSAEERTGVLGNKQSCAVVEQLEQNFPTAHFYQARLGYPDSIGRSRAYTMETSMKKSPLLSLTLTPMLLLGAWSSAGLAQDSGQRISQRGAMIGEFGSDWTDGNKEVIKGRKLIEKSAKQAADADKKVARARQAMAKAEDQQLQAQADRAKGETLISRGTARMAEAEERYAAVRAGPSAVVN